MTTPTPPRRRYPAGRRPVPALNGKRGKSARYDLHKMNINNPNSCAHRLCILLAPIVLRDVEAKQQAQPDAV